MKKIGIDARLLTQTGVGTYLQNLLFYLDKMDLKNKIFYVYLREEDFNNIDFKNKNIIKKIANQKWHSFSEQISFFIQLIKDNLDLMHFTYFSYPIFYFKKFIATIHDTTPLRFKTGKASTKNIFFYQIKHFIFKIVLFLQVKRASKIITPTETVKNELINIYGKSIENKIDVIYEGVNYKILKTRENNLLKNKFKNFFIYVGNFYPHKNVENLIKAFKKIKKNIKLLLIGPDDYFTDRLGKYLKKVNNKNILLIKKPSLNDLVYFYKNALAIIHPSLSEGFGLPLIEAAYFNRPIIASDIPIFKELWKNQYVSFNPKNIDDIFNKINYFLINKPKFNYQEIIKNYSFEKMTKITFKLYESYC